MLGYDRGRAGSDARRGGDGHRGAVQGGWLAVDAQSRYRGLDVRDHGVDEVGRIEGG